jgi:hypothetical protein
MRLKFLLLPLVLAACGTNPEPFYGNPGPEAARLAIPPAPVLIVPPPTAALLSAPGAQLFAKKLADALVALDIPCMAGPASPGAWQLIATATQSGDAILPAYKIIGPDKKTYGATAGAAEPAAAWTTADPATLAAAAATDAAPLTQTLAAINAAVQQSNPNSLENRPPRIFVGPVTGAPGDGDHALPLDLGRDLPGPDTEVVSDAKRADFSVTAAISTSPYQGGQILVELDWTVRDSGGRKIGQVTQLHPLDPGDITPYWGDVAAAAAQEAATGVQQVVLNAVLKKAK